MVRINKTTKKDLYRTIRANIKRYISLILIILLGVGFYVGMKSSSPSLEKTMKDYFYDVKYMDLLLASEIGITNDELQQIKNEIPEIDLVEGGFYEEALVEFTDQETKKSGEYVTAIHSYDSKKQINQLKLKSGHYPTKTNECIADASLRQLDYELGDKITINSSKFKNKELIISGFSRSPAYISVERGSSSLSSGKIQYFIYVNEDNYETSNNTKNYSVAHVKLKDKYEPFTKEYNQYVLDIANKIEELSVNISAKRREEFIADKERELNDANTIYEDEKAIVLNELESKKNDLDKAEEEINNAEAKIMTDEEVDLYISAAKLKVDAASSELEITKALLDMASLDKSSSDYISLQSKYNDQSKAYKKTLNDYNYAKAHLKEDMQNARVLLEEKKQELNEARTEYSEKEKEVITELEKQYSSIIEAKKSLKKLESQKWSVYTRQDQEGYNNYSSDIYRIKGLSRLFPITFFLVAALVTSSTINRLIQEERTKIGLFKSLGYNDKYILYKYVFYAVSAALFGTVLGIILGIAVFPTAFEEIYSLLYFMPDLKVKVSVIHVVLSVVFSLLSTVFVALITINDTVKEQPSALMMPKSEEYKNKTVLEKNGKLWRKIPFMKKIPYRNIFRKLNRSLMAVFGIAGCTALIIAGFGIRDSITGSMSIQFGKIMDVSAQFFYKSDLTDYEMQEEKNRVDNLDFVLKSAIARQEAVKVRNGKTIYKAYNIIPDDPSQIEEMVRLENIKGNSKLVLTNKGVIITEKLSQLMNLSEGDSLLYYDSMDVEHEVLIIGVTENYVYDYIYMTKELYKEVNDIDAINNSLFVKFKKNTDSDKSIELINQSGKYSNYISIDRVRNSYENVMEKFAKILVVITISAGLLAFVVLYNLSKINIGERLREIATLKVLGYRSKEINKYINSEMKLLTFIGIIVGIIGGYFLTNMILIMCEVDEILFYHGISYTSYIYSVIITLIFSKIINIFVKKDLSEIDMVNTLKTKE